MDSPLSWFVLLCLAICFGMRLARRAFDEMEERKNHEWDDKW